LRLIVMDPSLIHKLTHDKWTEAHVSSWLRHIGIKECYIKKLEVEEVTGPVLSSLSRQYLSSTIGMKSGQTEHLLKKRDELIKSELQQLKTGSDSCGKSADGQKERPPRQELHLPSQKPDDKTEQEKSPIECSDNSAFVGVTLSSCEYRKFDEDEKHCRYVKHSVLPPETGIENLIVPCHEYKSLETAHTLDSKRLQAKVASEVLRFACACMNMRSNGTIHFGVMDKVKGTYKHGEIIGIPVKNKEDFVDALEYIERSFRDSMRQYDARKCIRQPRFIEVLDKQTTEKTFVIEYDVVPKASIVKGKLYRVGIPKFSENDKKVKLEDRIPYWRVGANTPRIPDDDLDDFIQGLREKDQQREEAESSEDQRTVDFKENQKRKLSILLTCGKTYMDNSLFYIIVTNKIQPQQLQSINFLIHMNLICVFDFDPDSETCGLCGKYMEHKAVNFHSLDNYVNDTRLGITKLKNHLQLFRKTSWIFCNGRGNFPEEEPCDENIWIRTRKKKLKKAVSLICNEILDRRSFVVVFLLMSDVEQPLVETFHEFYAEMNGHDFLTVISDSREYYKKWSSLAQVSCEMSTLKDISIAEMPLSHIDATVQSIQLSKSQPTRTLPVFNGGVCFLKSVDEDELDSLEVISIDQCDEINVKILRRDQIQQRERYFYRGGKIEWMNFWLADKHKCGEIIKRDAYEEVNTILTEIVHRSKAVHTIESVNIYHHPGSGGSTVARQIIWTWRMKVRCAVVNQDKVISTVCEHATRLRDHDERDKNNCLPVLLLLEDQSSEYVHDLRQELIKNLATKKISPSVLCFILLICNRSGDPERMCRASPSQTVAITHRLSSTERSLFSKKAEQFRSQFQEDIILPLEWIQSKYIEDFVKNLLEKMEHSSPITRLIRFVALLNCYVDNSFISVSHCEAYLGIANHGKNYLSDEARHIFIHFRDDSTHISSVRIIHPLVAKEILRQMCVNVPQSVIAMDLITDKVLVNHRFGRDVFQQFIRALFIRHNKKSRGDPEDTAFSPLIEHVTTEEDGIQKAVDLMRAAYSALGKDGYVAQQLAQFLCTNLRLKEAAEWAEKAKCLLPCHTSVLDTLGQVYKRWFYHLHDTLEEKQPSTETGIEIISTALKGMSAFQASEKTLTEIVSINSSYHAVDVGCRLLKFLSGLDIFSSSTGKSELVKYLLTEYIPEDVKKPWQEFHWQLKQLQKRLHHAFEFISEDLCYFQTDIHVKEAEVDARDPEQVPSPREWLTRKGTVYTEFFCTRQVDTIPESNSTDMACPTEPLSPFQRQMKRYQLGGGNVTSILSLIHDTEPESARDKLETIISMHPKTQTWNELDETELVNFIFCQIALNCTQLKSSKLLSLLKLQDLSKRFTTQGRNMSSASALFLVSLLFWPETSDELSPSCSQILSSATDALKRLSEKKCQNASQRKSRIVFHFFLGKGKGLDKIVHKSVFGKQIKDTLSDRKLKWLKGEVWKTSEVVQLLKRVDGRSEKGQLFIQGGTRDSRIRIFPQISNTLPHGNENVTFYVGFSFGGVFAFDIQVKK
uniref:SAM domain-containing protein n=1 Tax=Sphaeramia orbicularis TaxID=375764 RepID=A0A672ZRY6_9TELE